MTLRLKGFRRSARGTARRCNPGTILRAPYVRIRSGKRSYVSASCITNQGAPGKGLESGKPGIGPLRSGDLEHFGYDNIATLSVAKRHLALAKAVHAYGSLIVWRKLNAIYIYTKRTSPASSRRFKADRNWVNDMYGIKAF